MSESKICPYCKKEIPKNAEECTHCRRILIERINTTTQTPKLQHKEKINYPQKIKEDITRQLNKIKSKGILVLFVIFLIIIFISNNNSGTLPINETKKTYTALPHGSIVYSSLYYLGGLGELTIENGTERDAVVKLVNNFIDKSIFTVYVSSKNTYTIRNISDGNYKLFFNSGKDYSATSTKFLINSSYLKFKDDFTFITKEIQYYDSIDTRYSTFKVTLHPVVGGTAKTDNSSEAEFLKY